MPGSCERCEKPKKLAEELLLTCTHRVGARKSPQQMTASMARVSLQGLALALAVVALVSAAPPPKVRFACKCKCGCKIDSGLGQSVAKPPPPRPPPWPVAAPRPQAPPPTSQAEAARGLGAYVRHRVGDVVGSVRSRIGAEWGGAAVEEAEAQLPGSAGEIEYVRVR